MKGEDEKGERKRQSDGLPPTLSLSLMKSQRNKRQIFRWRQLISVRLHNRSFDTLLDTHPGGQFSETEAVEKDLMENDTVYIYILYV